MATWGKHKQCTCEVKHVAAVLEWAAKGYGGINVLGPEQRAELAAAVQKTACDLASKELTCMTGSIGADIAGVDAEVRCQRADLESAKEDLQRTHTELAAVQAEANRFSLAHSELAEEVRLRTQLAHMHAPGPLLLVEEDASINETRDQVI